MNKELKRTTVITGATGGLGSALTRVFASWGYYVIGMYRSNDAAAERLQNELLRSGHESKFIKQDLTSDGEWKEFDETLRNTECDELTLIANACAPFSPKPLQLIDWNDVETQFAVSVKGTFSIFKRLLPAMAKKKNGIFVSILSTAIEPPQKGFAAYAMAKSALGSLTNSINAEFSGRGIRAFSFSPDFMETALTDGWSEHLKKLLGTDKPPKTPEQYAKCVLELCLDESSRENSQSYLNNAA